MTWPQLEAFTEAATHRRKVETLERAQLLTLAVSTGFSGDREALRNLARELGIASELGVSATSHAARDSLQRMATNLSDQGLVRMKHGTNRR